MRAAERRRRLAAARLYLCIGWREDLTAFLDLVLPAGVDVVQLRDKDGDDDRIRAGSVAVRDAAARHDRLFILNDRPDLAAEVGADGVHVGQEDVAPATAREVVGPQMLVGRSTHDRQQVDAAQPEDCDYFAVGPVSATPTKPGRAGIGLDPVRHAAQVATKPWFVTGGMSPATIAPVLAAGARGVVVVRALTEAHEPATVAATMAELLTAADR